MSRITKIVPEGLVTEGGKLHKADVLVCATGVNVAFKPAFRVLNGAGKTINEDWVSEPRLVLSSHVDS
jgi:hypothetical protein